ncbi:MAG: helix-turn-helix transcriptional regulator [Burkholderiaceae bacterium]
MSETRSPRIRNPETLALLGRRLRQAREAAGLAQSKVKPMRQGTVSKVENGLDVTLDTFVTYAAALGLEVALVPIGRAAILQADRPGGERASAAAPRRPTDLLSELDHLKDPE